MKTSRPACPLIKGLLLTLCILFLFNSCQKEDRFGLDPQVRPSVSLLGESQVYFRKLTEERPLQARPRLSRHRAVKIPLWDKAQKVQLSIGEGLKVPLAYIPDLYTYLGTQRDKVSLSQLSYLLIYKDKVGRFHAELVLRIPSKFYWDNKHRSHVAYSGKILVEDWWGNPIKAYWKETNGNVSNLGASVAINKQRPGLGNNLNAPAEECEITDWYDCVSLNRGRDWDCRYSYTEINCPTRRNDQQTGDGGGGTNESPESSDYAEGPNDSGGAGGGIGPEDDNPPLPDEQTLVKEIENELQNPCLKMTLNMLIHKELNGKLSYILNEIFGQSRSFNLNFTENYLLPDNVNGRYRGYTIDNNGSVQFNVELNGNTLPNAAMEYTSVTIVHEVLHAYFEQEGLEQLWDHDEMALGYRTAMSEFLLQIFPNSLNVELANALVWEGLQGTSVWRIFSNTNPNQANHIRAINLKFHDGIQGSKCLLD